MKQPRLVLLVAALFLLGGCSTLRQLFSGVVQDPELEFQRADVRNVSLGGLTLDLTWKVDNPNGFGLNMAGLDYRFRVEGQQLSAGRTDKPLSVPANGTGTLTLPLDIAFDELGRGILAVLSQAEVGWDVDGTVQFDTPVGAIGVPFKRDGRVPVPRLPKLSIASVDLQDLSLTGANLKVQLGLDNPNGFSLPLDALSYAVRLSGHEIGTGNTRLAALPAKGKSTITLPLRLSFASAGRTVYDALRSGTVDLGLTGRLDAGPVEVPVDVERRVDLR